MAALGAEHAVARLPVWRDGPGAARGAHEP